MAICRAVRQDRPWKLACWFKKGESIEDKKRQALVRMRYPRAQFARLQRSLWEGKLSLSQFWGRLAKRWRAGLIGLRVKNNFHPAAIETELEPLSSRQPWDENSLADDQCSAPN